MKPEMPPTVEYVSSDRQVGKGVFYVMIYVFMIVGFILTFMDQRGLCKTGGSKMDEVLVVALVDAQHIRKEVEYMARLQQNLKTEEKHPTGAVLVNDKGAHTYLSKGQFKIVVVEDDKVENRLPCPKACNDYESAYRWAKDELGYSHSKAEGWARGWIAASKSNTFKS